MSAAEGFPRIPIPQEASSSVEAVLRFLVTHLVMVGKLRPADHEAVVRLLLKREQLGSTGIGRGFAIPHTKTTAVTEIVVVAGTSDHGVPWDSVDELPVYVVCLLLSPTDRPGDHLRALEGIARGLR